MTSLRSSFRMTILYVLAITILQSFLISVDSSSSREHLGVKELYPDHGHEGKSNQPSESTSFGIQRRLNAATDLEISVGLDELVDATSSTSSQKLQIVVKQDGTGDYKTVQEAVNAVPTSNSQRVIIKISSGTYLEKVSIPSNKAYITFLGDGATSPVISWNDNATSAGSTWASGTVAIDAAYFVAKSINFQNTAPAPPPGVQGGQAIALRISGDMAAFYDCEFLGAQDTLCDMQGRHYFKNCYIQGSIDFIFGNGQSIYTGCRINSIATSAGSLTAQYRQNTSDGTGFTFINCNITGTGQVLLGRAWGEASRVVFASSSIADIILPSGWADWNNASLDATLFYGEFNNSGPGADRSGRVSYSKELSEAEVQPFVDLSFIGADGWLDPDLY